MSGTSLDGVDIALCNFELNGNRWHFSIKEAKTIKYSAGWKKKLSTAQSLSSQKLLQLHSQYGTYLGELCNRFITERKVKKVDLISSHGHTIFHQPSNKFTFQLGNGNALYAATHLPIAFDFRSLDVTLGGQGAPLVPIGDELLFSNYDACLNLGGIANVSMQVNKKRIAYDICYCNMALNLLASKTGKPFDENGRLALQGVVNKKLLSDLSKVYSANRAKRQSLAREGFESKILALIENDSVSLNDRLRTVCESVANEIVEAVPTSKKKLKLLVTGGGAHNRFLINLIQEKLSKVEVVVPSKTIVDFKEALIFAFLGVLKFRGEINVLKSVTGASRDSSSGILVK
jgi:anhydro-N-acetylmuramic acid kinase